MNDGQIRIVQLNCVSCSATLDISQGMERLACGFCGTSQTVERSGGTISLKSVEAVLQQVKQGTDKTAAELAIARFTKERNEMEAKLSQFSMIAQQQQVAIVNQFKGALERYRRLQLLVLVFGGVSNLGLLGYFLIGFTASMSGEQQEESQSVLTPLILLLVGFALFVFLLKFAYLRGNKVERTRDSALRAEKMRSGRILDKYMQQIAQLNRQIAEKRRITDA